MSVRTSKLSNGVQVATRALGGNRAATNLAAVSVAVRGGSRAEAASGLDARGVTSILACSVLNSSQQRSALRLNRELELLGANARPGMGDVIGARAEREALAYSSVVPADGTGPARLLSLMADAICAPRLQGWEIRDAQAQAASAAHQPSPAQQDEDVLFEEAFRNVGLANSAAASPQEIHAVSTNAVREAAAARFTGSNIAVVASGDVDHDAFVEQVQNAFGYLDAGVEHRGAASPYHGGEVRRSDLGNARFIAAFEGLPLGHADSAALAVLYAALGIQENSHGQGPGRGSSGLLSRFMRNQTTSDVVSLRAFSESFSDTGVFGVAGVGERGTIVELSNAVGGALKAAATSLSDEDIARAKGVAKYSAAWSDADTPLSAGGARAAQALLAGTPIHSAEETLAALDAVSPAQVRALAENIILKGRATIAGFGDVRDSPTREDFEAALR